MIVTKFSIKGCFLLFLALFVGVSMSVFAQSSNNLDLDGFDSDDDFINFLVGVLGDDPDEEVDTYQTINDYTATTTTRSITIKTIDSFSATKQEDTYTIYMYTDAWSTFEGASSSKIAPFMIRKYITPSYNSEGQASMYIGGLLPGQTYTFVIAPGKNIGTQEGIEMTVETKESSAQQSKGFDFLLDVLFDWSVFSSYIDEGENSAMFLSMLMDSLYDMSSSRQETVIRGMGKNLKAMKQFGFTSLGLDYDGFIDILEDAAKEVGGTSLTNSSSSSFTNMKDLDIKWQVLPSKNTGKKWVVFRTNFSALGIHRATWHMGNGKIHGCDREMCNKFGYELDAGDTHHIQVNMSQFKINKYEGFNEKLVINL